MFRFLRSQMTFANAMSTIAVTLALGGVSYAATMLPGNSVGTKQLRRNAVTGAKVRAGSLLAKDFARGQLHAGHTGPIGPAGPAGPAGQNGANGHDGAVAGYSATQNGSLLDITSTNGVPTQVPGMTKTLPAGSYLASGTILASVSTTSGPGLADIKCVLTDTPSDGSALTSYTTRWLGPVNVPAQAGHAEMPYALAFTTKATSTLSVGCYQDLELGTSVSTAVENGTLQVVQTNSNS